MLAPFPVLAERCARSSLTLVMSAIEWAVSFFCARPAACCTCSASWPARWSFRCAAAASSSAAHTCRRALVDEDARTHGHALPTQRRVPVAIILGLLVLLLAVVVALFFFFVVVLLLLLVLLAAARRLRTWWCFRSGGREAA
jgi:hypothetical protein